MSKEVIRDKLRIQIDTGNFIKAALLAFSFGKSEEEIQELQLRGLKQISAEYRNVPGTKRRALQHSLSKRGSRGALESQRHLD